MKNFVLTTVSAVILAIATQGYAAKTTTNTKSVAVSPSERAKIEEVVHQYLLDKPEVIVEAIQNYQRKQYQQAEQTVKKTQEIAGSFADPLFHGSNDPVAGNPNGTITIVEFFDYQCPHCVDMAPVIEGIIKSNPDVRIVFKEFPIRGPQSNYAARAALAANKQGKYYDFSHALLIAKKPLTEENVLEVAKTVGLNIDQLKKDMSDKSIDDQLKTNLKLAQDLKLFGTPAFFIGKTEQKNGSINYVPGGMNKDQLQEAIDKAKS